MTQDLRFALRQLRRTPGFAAVAVLTFALGIGANTAVFSVMNAVVLRLLPVAHPEELVYLHTSGQPSDSSQTGFDDSSLSLPVYQQLRTEEAIFTELMAYVPLATDRTAVRYGNEPETVWTDMVSGNLFTGLGVQMARGRGFTPDDESQHTQNAVISYAYWTRRFARNPSAIGDTLFVKGVPFTIIGVTPEEFAGVSHNHATDVWIPIQTRPELRPWGVPAESAQGFYDAPNWWFLMVIGRLAPGMTADRAVAQAQPIFQRAAYSATAAPKPGEQVPKLYLTDARGIQGLRDNYREPLTLLMAMVAVVLLIACGNVSMLLSARNAAREREFSLRTALGGNRLRLFRQLITESLLLVSAGAVVGWSLAVVATRALARWSDFDVTLTPDRTVLLFTIAVSVISALLFGLAPLRRASRVPIGLVLKSSASNITSDRRKIRGGQIVVAVQVALCLILLVGASLLVRTLRNLSDADLGFRARGLLVFGVAPPQSVRGDESTARFYQSLTGRLRTLPGIDSVTLMSNRIGSGWSNNTGAVVDGKPPDVKGFAPMRWNAVGPDYFHVLGTPLLLGRDFTDADNASAPPVAIVNETFVKRYLGGHEPLGHRVSLSREYTIVGVTANSRYTGVREAERPMAYFPYQQVPEIGGMHIELRANGDPRAFLPQVRQVVQEFGPDLPLLQPMTQEEQFGRSFSNERLMSRLATFFGLMAALLVATGLYGTLAYRVSRRTSEIGVRMALGAERKAVLWMIMRESLVVSAIGIVVGLPLAFVASKLLKTMLFGLTPADPISFAAALAAIVVVATGASLIPARRASAVDPMVALRYE
ncbi:MAG TPA: ABC transporter permease [Vicinamibacterales bacterium]|jgi:predicted permease|nr:ABC transporter permease [Vicinamibacterales bacterium]